MEQLQQVAKNNVVGAKDANEGRGSNVLTLKSKLNFCL